MFNIRTNISNGFDGTARFAGFFTHCKSHPDGLDQDQGITAGKLRILCCVAK
jgi:hypothetical protein